MKKNFAIQIEAFNKDNAKETLTVADADYVPTFKASFERNGSQAYLNGKNSDSSISSVGVSQKIVTGAVVSVSSALDRSKVNPASGTYNPAYDADVSLSVSQPLLKSAGVTANKAAINRAKIGVDKAGHEYRGAVLSVVKSVEAAYYSLCYVREQKAVRAKSLALAEILLSESTSKKEVGVATELDVLQSEVGVADARRSLIEAEQAVRDAEDTLLSLIGQFELDSAVGAVSFPALKDEQPSFERSYKLAQDNQPDLLSTRASIKQSEIDAKTSKNARLPSLNLDSAVGYNTSERKASTAFSELPGSDGYSWEVGLTFSMPWGLKAERARYRSALNSLNQNRARLQQQEQNLAVAVRSAVRSVQTNLETVKIAAKATELSEKKYELEKAKYDNGKSTARRVLEAQDDLESARVSELQSNVTLRNAIAELRRLEGSSLSLFGINI